jgi:hypothetical protein
VTRRRALRISGIATAILFVVLAIVDEAIKASGGPGIIAFELAGTTGRVAEILGHWGQEGRDAARVSLAIDFVYLVVYGVFLTLAVLELRDAARERGWTAFARPGTAIAVLPGVAAACDVVEDVGLWLMIEGEGTAHIPPVATAFAAVKFVALAVAIGYLLVGVAALAKQRYRASSAA